MVKDESSQEKLVRLLKDLFQFDVSELDFGIYRIMNHKRDAIERFIEKDLIERAELVFKEYARESTSTLKKELDALKSEINEIIEADTIDEHGKVTKHYDIKKVKEYLKKQEEYQNAQIAQGKVDDVYNYIYEFFSRYYDQGDFFSKRRRGGRNKYAIPYNGEEVLLHWANRDQYYIKSGEYFTNYEFRAGAWEIKFILVHAEVDPNNIKGEKRYFVLADQKPELDSDAKEFRIFFDYRGLTKDEEKSIKTRDKQTELTTRAEGDILFSAIVPELKQSLTKKLGENEKSLLQKNLNTYIAKNISDFFIHKNLKGFLDRELEFYIKNEVLLLDEIERMNETNLRQMMTQVKAIREISQIIIDFLAQIENFQKMLWEKKKFVIDTQYCITMGNIDEVFYPQIAANDEQWVEWKELFQIYEDEKQNLFKVGTSKQEQERRVAFLKAHQTLVLDSCHFDVAFVDKLLASFDDLEDMTDGLLIHSENFQALQLLRERYRGVIKCIYIDPPYNTGKDGFIYKDAYQHSTWLTMMEERLELGRSLLCNGGVFFVSLDDREVSPFRLVGDKVFDQSLLGVLKRRAARKTANLSDNMSDLCDYIVAYCQDKLLHPLSVGTVEDQTRPVFNEGNAISERIIPQGVEARCGDGLYARNTYCVRSLTFELLDDLVIENGRTSNSVRVKGPFRINQDVLNSTVYITRNFGLRRYLLDNEKEAPKVMSDLLDDPKLYNELGSEELSNILALRVSKWTPKPIGLVEFLCRAVESNMAPLNFVIDFFAGSGTTGQAVISLNRQDGYDRKFILVEMADYFATFILPRIKKITYTPEWKDGKPVRQATTEEVQRSPRIVKYIRLEGYEDALNNIVFQTRDKTSQETLETFKDFFVRYMLDYETRDSPTRLAMKDFKDPFNYKLWVERDGVREAKNVDLVETFNYLLGLEVNRIVAAKDGNRYYRTVQGKKRDGKIVLIVWRSIKDIDLECDRDFIERTFLKDAKPDILYANGQCYVKDAVSIEPDFKKLMGA